MTKFLGQYTLPNISICDDLITCFKNNPSKRIGIISYEGKETVKKDIKDSTDLTISIGENELVDSYVNELQVCLNEYKKDYKYANESQSPYSIIEYINIQHYSPGQAFHDWHCERSGSSRSLRHLVFMTYLNNVTDKGGTEFYYHNVCIEPKKGLTLIWPTDWTFTHRGVPSPTQEKYIITGWYSYVNRNEGD